MKEHHGHHLKLLVNQKVEVRSSDKGLLGSWHCGTVISCKKGIRVVQYDTNDFKDKHNANRVEGVQTSDVIDGVVNGGSTPSSNCRGWIRPLPPPVDWNIYWLHYGYCVDVFHNGVRWEGVVFDHEDGSIERSIFLPDTGDVLKSHSSDLRITQDWDECTGVWKPRGDWLFLEVLEDIEKEWPLVVSVRQIWYDMQLKNDYTNLKEWTSSSRDIWKEVALQVVMDNFKLSVREFFHSLNSFENFSLQLSEPVFDGLLKHKAYFGDILPKEHVENRDELLTVDVKKLSHQSVEEGTSELFRDSTNCKEPTQRNQATWFPAGPDLIPTAEFCIDAINKYSNGKRSLDDTLNVRKHLLFLGWKIEFKKIEDVLFFRYTEPQPNSKTFVSLVRVCEYLRESTPKADELSCSGNDKIPAHTSQRAGLDIVGGSDKSAPGILSEAPQDDQNNLISGPGASTCPPTEQSQEYREELVQLDIEAEYGPEAVLDYYSGLAKRDDKLASKAKQHLSYVGWKIYSVPKVNKVQCRTKFRYSSPNGVLYHTLLSACRAYIDDSASGQRKAMHSSKDSEGMCDTHRSVPENQPAESSGRFLSLAIDLGDVRETKGRRIKRKSIFSNDVSPSSKSQNKKSNKGRPIRPINSLSGHVNTDPQHTNDDICSVCHYGGKLVMCDQCPSSFHTACINLKDIPEGDWFCPSCCCKICGEFNIIEKDEVFRENNAMNCHQCERKYHIGCLRKTGIAVDTSPTGHWFCKRSCEQIFFGLQKFLGKTIPVGVPNLTWTLMKHAKPGSSNIEGMPDIYGKLNLAVQVMHEGFQPLKEIRTGKDLVEDVIFNRRYELNNLNYQGFYTVVLEENDEVIVAATLRVFGEQVAEIPLVATRFRYRRRGMCRILMNELEKALSGLGVKRIVLPAVESSLDTWIFGFGFSEMTQSERHKFLDYNFLDFQSTKMCQKVLLKTPNIESAPQG